MYPIAFKIHEPSTPLVSPPGYPLVVSPVLTTRHCETLGTLFVLVIVNRYDPEWGACFRGLDTQMLTVTVYQRKDGIIAHEIDGSLTVAKENRGFFRYSASDRSIRIPATSPLDLDGQVRVEDPYGAVGIWIASRSEDGLWLTKQTGDPGFPHREPQTLLANTAPPCIDSSQRQRKDTNAWRRIGSFRLTLDCIRPSKPDKPLDSRV
jgi:hypothetical protein